MKLKRIQSGVYETLDGKYRIEREGYEQMRDETAVAHIESGDGRYTGGSKMSEGSSVYHSGTGSTMYYEPEVPVWMIFKDGSDDHNGNMFDTLKECRQWIEHEIKIERR